MKQKYFDLFSQKYLLFILLPLLIFPGCKTSSVKLKAYDAYMSDRIDLANGELRKKAGVKTSEMIGFQQGSGAGTFDTTAVYFSVYDKEGRAVDNLTFHKQNGNSRFRVHFDQNGMQDTNEYYYSDKWRETPVLSSVAVSEYDNAGNLLKCSDTRVKNGTVRTQVLSYQFDKKGRVAKRTEDYIEEKGRSVTEFRYKRGNLPVKVQSTATIGEKKYNHTLIRKFDKQGRELQVTSIRDNNVTTVIYGRDPGGNLIQEFQLYGRDTISKIYRTYNNREIISERSVERGETYEKVYEYEPNGLVKSMKVYQQTNGESMLVTKVFWKYSYYEK